jgi:hypothetical protein
MPDLYAPEQNPNFIDGAFIDLVPVSTEAHLLSLKRALLAYMDARIGEMVLNRGQVGGASTPSPGNTSDLKNLVSTFLRGFSLDTDLRRYLAPGLPVLELYTDWKFNDGSTVFKTTSTDISNSHIVSLRPSHSSYVKRYTFDYGGVPGETACGEATINFAVTNTCRLVAEITVKTWTPTTSPTGDSIGDYNWLNYLSNTIVNEPTTTLTGLDAINVIGNAKITGSIYVSGLAAKQA